MSNSPSFSTSASHITSFDLNELNDINTPEDIDQRTHDFTTVTAELLQILFYWAQHVVYRHEIDRHVTQNFGQKFKFRYV